MDMHTSGLQMSAILVGFKCGRCLAPIINCGLIVALMK